MIKPEKALRIILKNTDTQGRESVFSQQSINRILAKDVRAPMDLPPFNRIAMDGFALKSVETKGCRPKRGKTFKVIGLVKAGKPAAKIIKKGQAMKVMTGGVLPQGADAVVMKEDACADNGTVTVFKKAKKRDYFCSKGEDIKRGKKVLGKGTVITPGVLGLLASLGIEEICVFRKPKVGILVTGNELCPPSEKLSFGKIHSANHLTLFHQLRQMMAEPVILGAAKDTEKSLREKIKKGLLCDVLLISGGVSAGDFDLVPAVLKKLGAKILFHKIAFKPGKPLLFARRGKTHIFGLPGNPVSTMVTFYKFVRPCLSEMCGRSDYAFPSAQALLAENITVEPGRHKLIRAVSFQKNGKLCVRRAAHQGSGNIISMAKADCYFEIKEGVTRLRKGTPVTIRYFPYI